MATKEKEHHHITMATTPSNTMTHPIQILNVTYKQYDVIPNQYLYYITGAHCHNLTFLLFT